MKEPRLNDVAYSQAPVRHLRRRIANDVEKMPDADEWYDDDFRRRYAAILLRERGQ